MKKPPPSRDVADAAKKPPRSRRYFTVAIILFAFVATLAVVFLMDVLPSVDVLRKTPRKTPAETPASFFEWEAVDGGVKIVKFLDERATEVGVPAQIDGEPVVKIGDRAFFLCLALTSVALPAGVKSIGDEAFYRRYSPTSPALPDSIQSVGDAAFMGRRFSFVLYGSAGSFAEEYAKKQGWTSERGNFASRGSTLGRTLDALRRFDF